MHLPASWASCPRQGPRTLDSHTRPPARLGSLRPRSPGASTGPGTQKILLTWEAECPRGHPREGRASPPCEPVRAAASTLRLGPCCRPDRAGPVPSQVPQEEETIGLQNAVSLVELQPSAEPTPGPGSGGPQVQPLVLRCPLSPGGAPGRPAALPSTLALAPPPPAPASPATTAGR